MTTPLPRIDHIIVACKDVKAAADHLLQHYGLASYEGGRHQGWGTQNYITPLGEGYIELAAVFDEQVALQCDWGRLILNYPMPADRPWALVTFCVETQEGVPATCGRLGLESARMLRKRPDGSDLTWEVGAMHKFDEHGAPVQRGPKPFFISWDDPKIRPDKTPAEHRIQPLRICYIRLSGSDADRQAMEEWIGTSSLPLQWKEGPSAILAVGIQTKDKGVVELP